MTTYFALREDGQIAFRGSDYTGEESSFLKIFKAAISIIDEKVCEREEENISHEELYKVTLEERFNELREEIGAELFDSLEYEDKKFMAEAAGIIDIDPNIDLDRIIEYMKDPDD